MHTINIRPRYLLMVLMAAPFLVFGSCAAWNAVSIAIREALFEVLRRWV